MRVAAAVLQLPGAEGAGKACGGAGGPAASG